MRTPVAAVMLALLVASLGVAPRAAAQRSPVVVHAAIGGTVVAQGLVRAGQAVKQGDPLVYVQTATSPTPALAAVAPADGQVARVAVKPGDTVKIGDPVVEIQPP
ncbi:MAG TPA: biotin/lipoyl-containing protein [bacterium]|nr:biotin/lipoyl-containing protein [bacterium]